MSKNKLYTEKEVEKLCRRAFFEGELFGRNILKKELKRDHSLPMGETFEEVANNFLKRENIENSLK